VLYSQFYTFPQLWVNQSIGAQLPWHLPPELPPPDWLPRNTPPISLDHALQVLLQTRSMKISECITQFTQSRPPSVSPNSLDHTLQVYLQNRSITASKFAQSWFSKCISTVARSRPRSSSLSSPTLSVVKCWSLEGGQPIINTPLHLGWHLKGIPDKEQFWLEECRKRVRGYDGIQGHDEPHKLCGSTKAYQECMPPSAWKDTVCISYIEMLSIYSGVFQIYTGCCWVHLHHPCISVCIYMERRR